MLTLVITWMSVSATRNILWNVFKCFYNRRGFWKTEYLTFAGTRFVEFATPASPSAIGSFENQQIRQRSRYLHASRLQRRRVVMDCCRLVAPQNRLCKLLSCGLSLAFRFRKFFHCCVDNWTGQHWNFLVAKLVMTSCYSMIQRAPECWLTMYCCRHPQTLKELCLEGCGVSLIIDQYFCSFFNVHICWVDERSWGRWWWWWHYDRIIE